MNSGGLATSIRVPIGSASTQPTAYTGKGFGDLPIGLLRPLAITGELGYQIQDVKINSTGDNLGGTNAVNAGLSIQYSMPYLKAQVRDFGFPEFVNRLFPIVELTWSAPVNSPISAPTQFTIAPGVIYVARFRQFGIEALIPGNTATGTHVGVIAQFHIFFDDLFPNSLGKPLVDLFH